MPSSEGDDADKDQKIQQVVDLYKDEFEESQIHTVALEAKMRCAVEAEGKELATESSGKTMKVKTSERS